MLFSRMFLASFAVLASLVLAAPTQILAQKPKEILWSHAFDLACRKFGESEFKKDTQKFGVEAFKDTNNNLGIYICQNGSMAIAPGFEGIKPPLEKSKGPDWLTGLDLPARKAGQKTFTKDTPVHAMEVFRDPNTDNWLYVTEKGVLASTPVKSKDATGNKAPKWAHSVDLNVRKGGEKDWKDATKIGIEVYHDQNTNNLVYITDNGYIAVVPAPVGLKYSEEGKAPAWLHGLDLACRKYNEPNFTKDTRKYGVEVFQDLNNGNLIFLCETGSLAVVGGPKELKAPTTGVKSPQWKHGLNLKARQYGEEVFSDKTRVFGGEVFVDENLGVTIYIGENGVITAKGQ